MNSDRIEGAARDIGGKLQQTVGMATGNGQLRAEGVAREVAGKAQNLYGQAADGVQDAAETVSAYAEDAYDRSSRALAQGSRTVEQQIERNPLVSIALAAAVGFAIGLVVSNRR